MKTMLLRKSLLRFAVLALSTGAAATVPLHAQDGPPPMRQGGPEMQQRQMDRMAKELELTPDQITQIKAIQADGRTQMAAMRDDTTTSGPDKRAKMMAMREAEQTKIKATLTDAQKVKYDAMMEKMKEQRGRREEGSAPPPPPPQN